MTHLEKHPRRTDSRGRPIAHRKRPDATLHDESSDYSRGDSRTENSLRLSLERYGALRGESEAYDELLDRQFVVEAHYIRRIVQPAAL